MITANEKSVPELMEEMRTIKKQIRSKRKELCETFHEKIWALIQEARANGIVVGSRSYWIDDAEELRVSDIENTDEYEHEE